MVFLVIFCLHTSLITAHAYQMGNKDQKPSMTPITGSKLKDSRDKTWREGPEHTPETTEGSFTKNCVCSKIYDPVCASNDKSYYNLCQMDCDVKEKNITVVHQGNCIPF